MTRACVALAGALLSGCTQAASDQERVYVISSEEVITGGIYLRDSANGEAVADVDGNLLEDIMPCFTDVRVVQFQGFVHGTPLQFWVRENEFKEPSHQKCLRESLPKHARIRGPFAVSDLIKAGGQL